MTEKENPSVIHPDRPGEEAYHLGWQNYAEGKFAQAVEQFNHALSFSPGEADYLYALGLTCEADGQNEKAIDAYQKAIAQLAHLSDVVRARMVRRMAQAHISKIQQGDWGAYTNPEHK